MNDNIMLGLADRLVRLLEDDASPERDKAIRKVLAKLATYAKN